jgi:NAD(P)-dependent dehydrogenase (short-subunit alcohol dehydrogenase family)
MSAPAQAKIIVLTGCTRGLGRALVTEFVAAGHTVVGCGRSGDEIFDLRFAYPAPHSFDVIDVAQPNRVALWAERVLAQPGTPDLLINNAALMNTPAPLWKVPAEEFAQLMAVNVSGVAHVIRAFVPAMVERGSGVIVNLSSGWGRSVSPEVGPYCTSKWAIEGLTKALAAELPKGMAAVPLNPGVIDTAMLRKCWADEASSYPKAESWAKVAVPFLLQLGPKDNGRSLSVPDEPS